jgi:hypothetical protein
MFTLESSVVLFMFHHVQPRISKFEMDVQCNQASHKKHRISTRRKCDMVDLALDLKLYRAIQSKDAGKITFLSMANAVKKVLHVICPPKRSGTKVSWRTGLEMHPSYIITASNLLSFPNQCNVTSCPLFNFPFF